MDKHIYKFGAFRLDTRERALESDGRPVSLAPKALDVLVVLVENRGRIVEKDDLIRQVWSDTFVEDNNLAFNISVLRKLFGECSASPRYIETVPRRGYRFVAHQVQQEDATEKRPVPDPEPIPRTFRLWSSRTFVVSLLTLIVAGTLTFYWQRSPKITDRDTIVLADFTNTTGDPTFDGTLRQGLAIELGQSPFLRLISDERIQRALPLMGQSKDARVTPEVAREICERTGSAAFLEGSIAPLGSQYVLSLRAKNCRTGEIVAAEMLQAAKKEEVLNALSQIARKLRTQVGESVGTIEKHDTPLEVTTTSIEALDAYSTGVKISRSSGEAAGVPFLKRAIELDPKFAMAHASLALFYADMGEPILSAESTRKAYELRDRATDNERLFITFSYDRHVTGNLARALQTLEVWAHTYPREVNAHGLMSGLSSQGTGRYETTIKEAEIAIGLDPEVTPAYLNLAYGNIYLDRMPQAEASVQRLSARKLEIADLYVLRYHLAFLRGDRPGMDKEAALAAATSEGRGWILHLESLVLARSGRGALARTMSGRAVELTRKAGDQERAAVITAGAAVWEGFFGNESAAKRGAMAALDLSGSRDVEYAAAFALALSGDSSLSQSLANDLAKRFPQDTTVQFSYLPTLRGLFAVAAHQGDKAAAEFQKILDHRGLVLADPMGAVARLQLGRALALSGDKAKAKAAYQDFLALWQGADSDIPLLKQAKTEYAGL